MTEEYSLDKEIVFYGLYPQTSYKKYTRPLYASTIDKLQKTLAREIYESSKVIFSNIHEIKFKYNEQHTIKPIEVDIKNANYDSLGGRLNIIIKSVENTKDNIYEHRGKIYSISQEVITTTADDGSGQPCFIKFVNDQGKNKVFKPVVYTGKNTKERNILKESYQRSRAKYFISKEFYETRVAETKVSFGVYVLEESVKDALRTLNQNVAKKVIENEKDLLNQKIALLEENQRKTSLGTFIDNLKNVVNSGIKQVGIEIMKNDSSTSAKEKREAKAQLISLGIDNLKNSVLANMKLVFNQSKIALLEKQKKELETQNKNLNEQKKAAEANTKTSNISSVINNLQYLATTQMKQIGNEIRNNNIKTSLGGIEKLNKVTEGIYNILSSKGLTFPWLAA